MIVHSMASCKALRPKGEYLYIGLLLAALAKDDQR